MVAGVAWAQHRGIRRVEVQVDDGPWHDCRIAADPTIDSWRQWVYAWHATAGHPHAPGPGHGRHGSHSDRSGRRRLPNGATGYDSIQVTVS